MRKLIKKILKEDDWDFVRDVKSNQDIAQEIADKTKIKDDLSHAPFRSPLSLYPSFYSYHYSSYNPPSYFTEYCKEQYGLTKGDIEDVWKRHKDIIKDKLNNINESNDLQWIKDIEPYIPFDEVVIGGKYAVQVMDNFEIALEGCGEEINDIPLYVIVEKILKLNYDDIYCGDRDSDVVPHWDGVKECLDLTFYNKNGDYLLDHWLAPDGLIRLVNVF